jgi:hypothetical protein
MLGRILKIGFIPSYSKEFLLTNGGIFSFSVPIVSFCDIPLSQIGEHVKKYGGYAIGVNTKFAELNGCNRVFYLDPYSHAAEAFINVLKYMQDRKNSVDEDESLLGLYVNTMKLFQNVKNRVGILKRKNLSTPGYEFYKEMEWRYVPSLDQSGLPLIVWEQDYAIFQRHFPTKPHLPDYALPLSFSDINWIVVKSNSDVPKIVSEIRKLQHLYASDEELNLLFSKVLTVEQIERDF